MSKLYFRYGAMNCGKSASLLTVAHNYEEQGKTVLLIRPKQDTRSKPNKIESRIGLSKDCVDFANDVNLHTLARSWAYINKSQIHCILVDEAQFLTKKQVKELTDVVDIHNIPVICYGLKNSYIDGKLFEGSEALLFYADKFEEIKNLCTHEGCNRKAIMNLRVLDGQPTYTGNVINCGDIKAEDDYYVPLCRKHYFNS